MDDYRPNSHKYKEDKIEKKVDKIVTAGSVKTRKKSELARVTDSFLSGSLDDVKDYIFKDVLLPSMKRAVSDIVANSVDMMLYGEIRKNSSSKSNVSNISYKSYYDRNKREVHSSERYEYEDIIIDNRGDAEKVLDQMEDILDTYNTVSVADLYDLVGITPRHTDNKYGWVNLSTASVMRVRDGYSLKLPRVRPLD